MLAFISILNRMHITVLGHIDRCATAAAWPRILCGYYRDVYIGQGYGCGVDGIHVSSPLALRFLEDKYTFNGQS